MILTESSVKELSNDVIKSTLTKKRMRDILFGKSYICMVFVTKRNEGWLSIQRTIILIEASDTNTTDQNKDTLLTQTIK